MANPAVNPHFRYVFENSPIGMSLVSRDGARFQVNRAMADFLGYTVEEIIGTDLCSPSPDDDALVESEHLRKMVIDGEIDTYRKVRRYRRKDGRIVKGELFVTLARDVAGNPEYFIAQIVEITDLAYTDTISQQLTTAVDALAESVVLCDADDRIVFCNKLFHDHNRPVVEYLEPGTPYKSFLCAIVDAGLVPDARGREEQWLHERLEQRRNPEGPFVLLRQDGLWLLMHEQRLPDGGTMLIATDISKLRQAEQAAKDSEIRLRDAIEAMSEGFAVYDSDERLVICNEPYRKTLPRIAALGMLTPGTKLEDILQAGIENGFVPSIYDSAEDYLEKRLRAFRHPTGPIEYETTAGQWVRFEERKTSDGGTVGIRTDITARKITEEQLRQAQKMEAVGQLTGGVAHDFNNLLGVIVGNLEFLEDSIGNDLEQQEMIGIALRAALHGAELTSRLLAFSRKQPLRPVAVDLNAILHGMTDLLQRTLGEMITVHTRPFADLKLAKIDPGQLETALLNLAVNARHAMPDGGQLTIETGNVELDQEYAEKHAEVEPGMYAILAVSDTGVGMSSDILAHAFDPFYTTKGVGEGSGLGLSMVHGFVKQSGGHVSIYSEQGKGTTVKLYFPETKAEGQPGHENTKMRAIPRGAGETVLIVEDDDSLRELAVKIVSGLGYKVEAFPDGPSAIAFVDEGAEIDVLFTDMVLPHGMNGVALAKAASERRPGLRVLYTSGYTQNAIVHNGVIDEGIKLLGKPYRRGEVAKRLREILERKG